MIAALALALLAAEAAPASGPPGHATQILIPSAGWHGREIRDPHDHDTVRTSVARRPLEGWSAGPVGFGTGYRRPGGSERVREVQRRLRSLGYRPGQVDGLFGRLTRASVAWFQVKHGLRVDGRATLATVRHLRARTGAGAARRDSGRDADSRGAGSDPWKAFNQLVGPRLPAGNGTSDRTGTPAESLALLALAALAGMLIGAALVGRRRDAPSRRSTVGDPPAPGRPAPPAPPVRDGGDGTRADALPKGRERVPEAARAGQSGPRRPGALAHHRPPARRGRGEWR